MARYFVKVIEEPHHGQIMFVRDSKTYRFVEDETKAFRQQEGLEEMRKQLLDAVTKE